VSEVRVTVRIINVYPDETVESDVDLTLPAPENPHDLDDWAEDHLMPLTGTGRTKGDAGYFVKITASPDLPILMGSEFAWGI
jgi:hypothetical protein